MYVGIDTSTKSVCIALLDKSQGKVSFEWYWHGLNGDNLFDKMSDAYQATYNWVKDNTCKFEDIEVGIEEPIYIQNGTTHMALCCIYGSVVNAFMDSGIIPYPVNISTWKKKVVGKGNAKKPEVKERMVQLLSLPDNLEQDVYDALAVAAYMYKR
jgi:Holliday junction resolvasome RuvABC endonuclease subunit